MWLVVNCKKRYLSGGEMGPRSLQARFPVWFMNHRIRHGPTRWLYREKPEVVVAKADETFIGGKARNMHVAQRRRRITGTGGKDKTPVLGIMERGGKVRTSVVPNRKKKTLQSEVKKAQAKRVPHSIPISSCRMRDWSGCLCASGSSTAAVAYVDGNVHTNGPLRTLALLKRGISGTYTSVEPFHLFPFIWTSRLIGYNNPAKK